MSRIIILGNSLSANSAIETIRQKDTDSEILLISSDGHLPYNRLRLASLLEGAIKEKDIYPCHEDFYKKHNVQVVLDQTIVRLSASRRYLTTEKKEKIDFDKLIITDTPNNQKCDIKGSHKEGVFGCVRLPEIKAISKRVGFSEHIIIQISSVLGLQTACALAHHKKDLTVVIEEPYLFSSELDEETGSMLIQLMENMGIRFVTQQTIEEILGDSEVKAVRLTSKKILAAETVIIDDVHHDDKFLEAASLELLDHHVRVNNQFQTSSDDVFALDALISSDVETKHYNDYAANELALQKQGRIAGGAVLNRQDAYEPALLERVFRTKNLSGFWLGVPQITEGGREFLRFDPQHNVFQKIYAHGTSLTGAVAFNADSQYDKLYSLISSQMNISGVEDQVLGENFTIDQIQKLQS